MRLPLLLALTLVAAGCVAPGDGGAGTESVPGDAAVGALTFGPVVVIDEVRAGGEPVIAITPEGTILVAAHPGWTHTRYPPSANLVTPASGQSYMWRSTDGGATFAPVGLPGTDGVGPRGVGQGVSDPDFAIDSNGRIYFTDLEALAAASVSWSDDDGATWLQGNNVASTYGPIDRNWLATHGTDVYFMGNYFTEEKVLRSTDGGLTWTQVGAANCGGDLSVRLSDGALLVGCGDAIDVSEDGGATFELRQVPDARSNARVMTEPAVDADGAVYTSWADEAGVWVAGSPDLGKTWWAPVQVAANGTNVWPWVVAGDAGRIGVVWYHTDDDAGPEAAAGDWYVDAAIVLGMGREAPEVHAGRVTPTPVFQGQMCQNGTTCQVPAGPTTGDRRLGDFFEAAVDLDGRLNVVFSIALDDSISHPGFAKLERGPSLYAGAPVVAQG